MYQLLANPEDQDRYLKQAGRVAVVENFPDLKMILMKTQVMKILGMMQEIKTKTLAFTMSLILIN